MANQLRNIKEIELIEGIKRRFKPVGGDVVVSIGDDAAVVKGKKDKYILYTADMLVEGVHFKKGEDPVKVGYKALAVSVSDIAAMGGVPCHALVSVGLPKNNIDKIASGLYKGIKRCCKEFSIDVIGGDTNRSKHLVIDCFVVGQVEKNRLVLRSGAKTGDYVFITGPLGGSLAGRHLSFRPRVREARFLVTNFKINSMIDLSDGLGVDLNRICLASGCGAMIFESLIPKNKNIKNIERALFDGEDFELLFTLSKEEALRLIHMVKHIIKNFKFFSIGRITDLFSGVRMTKSNGKVSEIKCRGFRHF